MSPKCQDIISKSVQIRSGCPAIYQLQVETEVVGTWTRMTVGGKKVNNKNKTILLVGETGTGKSTMINALLNYAIGVKWEHKICYEIIEDDKTLKEKDQSESLTSDVSVYEIFGLENEILPYSLTLIDTPGFGDTKGTEHDLVISQKLFDLFQSENGVRELNVVALVLKATDNRQTDRLMYVLNSIMSLLGKDMIENVVVFITNWNGAKPTSVLHALDAAEIKCARNAEKQPLHFLFDNCQNEERTADTHDSLICAYKRSVKGMEAFTDFLKKTTPRNLDETVKVLNRCIRLAACIQNLQERVVLIEARQEQIRQTQKALNKYEREMTENEDFNVEIEEPYRDKDNIIGIRKLLYRLGIKPLCCKVCEENCQLLCCSDVENSLVMQNGNCTSCTQNCPASEHEKASWIYVTKTKKVQKTKADIKEKYDDSKARAETKHSVLDFLKWEMTDLQAKRLDLLKEAYNIVDELDKITLNVNSIYTHVHLDFLIQKMEEEGDTIEAKRLKLMKSKQDKKIQAALRYIFHKLIY